MKQSTIAVLVLMCATTVNSSPGDTYFSTNRLEWCLDHANTCFGPSYASGLTRLCNTTTADIDCNDYRNTETCFEGVRKNCTEAQLGCYNEVKFVGNVSCYRDFQVNIEIMSKLCSSLKALQSSANCGGLMQEDYAIFGSAGVNATSLAELCTLANHYISGLFDKYQTKYGKESATAAIDAFRSQLILYGCDASAESNPTTTAVLVTTVAGNYTHNHSLKLSAVISTLFLAICLPGVM